jgi:hypothetical protein
MYLRTNPFNNINEHKRTIAKTRSDRYFAGKVNMTR